PEACGEVATENLDDVGVGRPPSARYVRRTLMPASKRLPWFVAGPCGLACAAIGVVLIFRPFTSLRVLVLAVAVGAFSVGVSSVVESLRSPAARPAVVAGFLWIVLGAVVLAWPGITIKSLAILVGVGLVVSGILDILAGAGGSTDERLASVL